MMKSNKLVVAIGFAGCVAMPTHADDYAPFFSSAGDITGLVESSTGHIYDREHIYPGDRGFRNNVYEFRVSSSTINLQNVVTAWLFCLDENMRRIGGIVNDNNEIMGSRLTGNIGVTSMSDKVHLAYLCELPIRGTDPDATVFAEDVAFAEVILSDHGEPIRGTVIDADGNEVEALQLQLMNRPEEDPFCNGELEPKRECTTVGSGIVGLHRHPRDNQP
jgi:hypothetical protein